MNVCIRADASIEIGTGHIMRCLTLAEQLRQRGAKVFFVAREHEGNLNEWIRVEKNFEVYSLERNFKWEVSNNEIPFYERWLGERGLDDAYQTRYVLSQQKRMVDWLIVDHYGIDYRWEQAVYPFFGKMMVIDDLANRVHDCDILLDQNLYEKTEKRYKGLVPDTCKSLLGPRYALLREQFWKMRKELRNRNGAIQRILIFFGGTDPTNETVKALRAVRMLNNSNLTIDVVVGGSNPNKIEIEEYCNRENNIEFHCQISNMAELMQKADLAIGAGGVTTWERACLGLPSIMLAIADNQVELCDNLSTWGVAEYLGFYSRVNVEDIHKALLKFLSDPIYVRDLQDRGIKLVDANGVKRVTSLLERYM